MEKRTRRNHSPGLKVKVAMAAIAGDKTLAELAQQFDIHPNQVTKLKRQLTKNASGVFASKAKTEQTILINKILYIHIF